jgi:glycosyltransferase involved in cell wall biosynthesis
MEFPLFPNVGVLALVPDEWGGQWQLRQQILTRLARYFHVVWCDPPIWWRHWLSGRSSGNGQAGAGPLPGSNLAVYHPLKHLPEIGRPQFLAQWTERERLRRAKRILLDKGCNKIIIYIWRPQYETALDLIDHDLSCYHIDDEYTFSEVELPISDQERRLIQRVDQVFIHSPALLEKKGTLNPHTLFVPNGVDYAAYASPQTEPEDLAAIPHPRIGYVGRIKEQLDFFLLASLARRHCDWSFVMIGPQDDFHRQSSLLDAFLRLPNVYMLGSRPVVTLPGYTQHLDVCMLCYSLNDYTKFIYPMKLHEYLAAGPPVVGTPIRSLLEFDHVIKLAHTVDEWSAALIDSLSRDANEPRRVEARRRVASQHDWASLVGSIVCSLCDRIGISDPHRVQRQTAVW